MTETESQSQPIDEIYNRFGNLIIPSLRTHQIQVAAVGLQVWQNLNYEAQVQVANELFPDSRLELEQLLVNTEERLKTIWLLHDLGNWYKFNTGLYPEKFDSCGGVAAWEAERTTAIPKYYPEEQAKDIINTNIAPETLVTMNMLRELGFKDTLDPYIQTIGFAHAPEVLQRGSLADFLIAYPDLICNNGAIVPVRVRAENSFIRFLANLETKRKLNPQSSLDQLQPQHDEQFYKNDFQSKLEANLEIEKFLLKHTRNLTPQTITVFLNEVIPAQIPGIAQSTITCYQKAPCEERLVIA